MSDTQVSKSSALLTFLGSLGGILIFVLIIWIAYLPNRPEPVNAQVGAERKAKADEARAAGISKLTGTEVIDAEAGTVRIPIEQAMKLAVDNYGSLRVAPVTVEVIDTAVVEDETSPVVSEIVEAVEVVEGEIEQIEATPEPVDTAAEEAAEVVE